jgi:hypothetical protein
LLNFFFIKSILINKNKINKKELRNFNNLIKINAYVFGK